MIPSRMILGSFLALGVSLLGSCASIVSKSTWPVSITSNPSQSEFVVENSKGKEVHAGTTPSVVSLKSGEGYFNKADYTVKFRKAGYNDESRALSAQMNGWYFGNIIFGGLLGLLIIDPLTGAMWKLPEEYSVTLTPSQTKP